MSDSDSPQELIPARYQANIQDLYSFSLKIDIFQSSRNVTDLMMTRVISRNMLS